MGQQQGMDKFACVNPGPLPNLQRSHDRWQLGFCCAVLVGVFCGALGVVSSYENAMDLWMFMNVGSLASLWFFFHDVPDAYAVKDCDELSAAFESNIPTLFKRCIPAGLTWWDFAFFPNSTQNLYQMCDGELTRVPHSFEALDGNRTSVVSILPCSQRTLAQKIDLFLRPTHDQDKDYIETHVYGMDGAELAHVTQVLQSKGVVPKGFKFPVSAATSIHFFSHGFSNVRSFHSHLDRVVSFGMGKREWHVVSPKHYGKFERRWTKNNLVVATRELAEATRVSIVQEKGDIFVMPPWWLHKTVPMDSSKERGINFNMQVLAEGQFIGQVVSLLRRVDLLPLLPSK